MKNNTNFKKMEDQLYKIKIAPVMTKWSEDVDTNNVWSEHPRPQMVRAHWMNLNGVWEFQKGNSADEMSISQNLSDHILVPFPWESSLSGVMEYFDTNRAWYRRTVEIPEDWNNKRIILNFGAVDWEAEVYVNGQSVGIHRGGYDSFCYDITDFISAENEQEIILRVYDPGNEGGQPKGKQSNNKWNNPGGVMYIPASGIWQTVWLEAVAQAHITDIKLTPDVDKSRLKITIFTSDAGSKMNVQAIVKNKELLVAGMSGKSNTEFFVDIPDMKLWDTENPFLYDLDVYLITGAAVVDSVKSYFGMRKIEVVEVDGIKRMILNGKSIFQMGPLDQGYWPDGIYTPPCDEAQRCEIQEIKDCGYNMIRKHAKVENQRWYHWCDKLGMLVWQDMPHGKNNTDDIKAQFKLELDRMIKTHWNHPSIILWTVFNEGWGEFDTTNMTKYVMDLDETRLVISNSGYNCSTDIEAGNVKDLHNYLPPKCPSATSKRAVVCGEYGSIGYIIPSYLWSNNGPYHGLWFNNIEDATQEYEKYIDQIIEMRDKEGMCAAVYTQWTDIENEINGIYTYDRKLIKIHKDRLKIANKSTYK